MISKERYCAEVCGGKCCYLYKQRPIKCKYLTSECRCAVYEKRFFDGAPALVLIGKYKHRGEMKPFYCGFIKDTVKDLPEDVKAQCWELHPEVLERDYGTEGID